MSAAAGDALVARVAASIARTGCLAPGEAVVAMVSGGADSTFLMHALAAVHDGPVHALTCDHGLRQEAAGECADVARAARGLGLPCATAPLGLAPGPGVQERARAARYAAAAAHARAVGATAVATGHTADDQAETVVMRLARGAGTAGASGMAPRRGAVARPLLDVRRAEARAWCRSRGVAFADDPSNHDPAHARVRARGIVGLLEDVSPGAAAHLATFAALARDEAVVIDAAAGEALARCAAPGGLDARRLAREPAALQRVLIRRLLTDAGAPPDATGHDHVEAVRRGLPHPPPRDVPGGLSVRAGGGVLRVVAPRGDVGPAAGAPPAALEPGGRVRVGSSAVRSRLGTAGAPGRRRIALPPGARVGVRGSAPGDRIALDGGGHALVRRVLAGARVPLERRADVPVVFADDRLVWIAGHRCAGDALVPRGEPAVVLELEDA